MHGEKESSSLQHTANEMLVTIDAAGSDEAICCIVVPNALLLDLSTKTRESLSLVACINEHIVDEAIVLNPESTRLETIFRTKTSAIASLFRRSEGRKKSTVAKEINLIYSVLWGVPVCFGADEYSRAGRVPRQLCCHY